MTRHGTKRVGKPWTVQNGRGELHGELLSILMRANSAVGIVNLVVDLSESEHETYHIASTKLYE